MEVIHLSVECFPVAKIGGLADVVGALPKFERSLGADAAVVMPWFYKPFTQNNAFKAVAKDDFTQGRETMTYTILKEQTGKLGFPLYLIKIPGKLDRPEIYTYPDEAEQWIAFQHAFLHWLKYHKKTTPDIIHCHDHHVGLIPFLTKHSEEFGVFKTIKTVFTVHNAQYQGWLDWSKSSLLPDFDTWKWGLMDWDGVINPMATAVKCADAYTAVSEGYLNELFVNANGLQNLFKDQQSKSHGIVNGIDTAYWDPKHDSNLETRYNVKTVNKGKKANKQKLCQKYNLPEDLPLVSFIGRFALEKGADLLKEIILKLFSKNYEKFSIFILGSGDPKIETEIRALQEQYPDYMGAYIGYNESLAHKIYAASDILLMPSRVEPCGLNQLYALKYGTIPVARAIGGLKDTVIDIAHKNGYGFVFEEMEGEAAVEAVERSLKTFASKRKWSLIRARAMRLDFSWNQSAQKYINLYNEL